MPHCAYNGMWTEIMPHCPLCNAESIGKEKDGNYVCSNPHCPVQVFRSQKQMEKFGEKPFVIKEAL